MDPPEQLEKELAALDAFRELMKKLGPPASMEQIAKMKVEKADIFICTPPKAGTTWMQQICHQLRSGGDMEFEEISEKIPFIEHAYDEGIDLDADQRFKPRMFKTHLCEALTPKGARYIVVTRHPYDMAVSSFKFMEGWMFEAGTISLDTFITEHLVKLPAPRGRNRHIASWWPRHADADVLWVFYEDMKEDLQTQVERVATFMGITDPAVISQAVHKSTFAFMKEHEEQFSEIPMKRKRNVELGLRPDAGSGQGKVRVGGGERHLLSERSKAALDESWRNICQPVLGAATFVEWRAAWKSEQEPTHTQSPQKDREDCLC